MFFLYGIFGQDESMGRSKRPEARRGKDWFAKISISIKPSSPECIQSTPQSRHLNYSYIQEFLMKALISGLLLALLVVGCDQSGPTGQSEQGDMFSEESMLKYTATADGDPLLQSPNGGMHNGPRHGNMIQGLTRFLELTEEQQAALRDLGDQMFAELNDIRDQVQAGDLTHEDAKVLVHDLRTQFMDAVRSFLTPDQLTKLDEWEQHRWERRHRRQGHHFGGR